jgi:hypothetical protein
MRHSSKETSLLVMKASSKKLSYTGTVTPVSHDLKHIRRTNRELAEDRKIGRDR